MPDHATIIDEFEKLPGKSRLILINVMNDTQPAGLPVFVFVHGFLGFEKIALPLLDIRYFRGIPELMRNLGVPFAIAKLPATGVIKERATVLDRFLQSLDADAYVLVGHSMGGLDGRYLLHHFATGNRVRALVTVGTPHRGSPIATWMLTEKSTIPGTGRFLFGEAISNLTTDFCRRFNDETVDVRSARQLSYGGCRLVTQFPAWWRPFAEIIDQAEGPNDGLVSVQSAHWGDYRETVRADHIELVGWSLAPKNPAIGRPFPHLDFYRRLVGDTLGLIGAELLS